MEEQIQEYIERYLSEFKDNQTVIEHFIKVADTVKVRNVLLKDDFHKMLKENTTMSDKYCELAVRYDVSYNTARMTANNHNKSQNK